MIAADTTILITSEDILHISEIIKYKNEDFSDVFQGQIIEEVFY
jgi:hypothetical protein